MQCINRSGHLLSRRRSGHLLSRRRSGHLLSRRRSGHLLSRRRSGHLLSRRRSGHLLSRRRLEVLRSRWMTQWRCMYSTPLSSCCIRHFTCPPRTLFRHGIRCTIRNVTFPARIPPPHPAACLPCQPAELRAAPARKPTQASGHASRTSTEISGVEPVFPGAAPSSRTSVAPSSRQQACLAPPLPHTAIRCHTTIGPSAPRHPCRPASSP